MRIMPITLSVIALSFIVPAFAADNPSYQNGVLTIPSIDTAAQVGQYQDATFKFMSDGTWTLLTFNELNNSKLRLAPIDKVEVITTPSFPVQVLLKVTAGYDSSCGSLGPIHQRFANNKFDVVINSIYANYPNPINFMCIRNTPFIKTIPLPVYGLAAGKYKYAVNGQIGSFTIAADNKLPGDCEKATLEPCQ